MSISNIITTTSKLTKRKVLSVFDFDGTLTYHDSFIPFLYFAFSKRYFFKKLLKMTLPILNFIFCKITREELKKELIKSFLAGVDEYWLNQQAEFFCNKNWKKLIRPQVLTIVTAEVKAGAEVTICSAAPALIVQPWANRLGIKVIGTQLEVVDGKLTGYIAGYNCRCAQKLTRLEHIYGNLNQYYLRAWGDTRGDYELLSAAQDPHWRYFHSFSLINNSLIMRLILSINRKEILSFFSRVNCTRNNSQR